MPQCLLRRCFPVNFAKLLTFFWEAVIRRCSLKKVFLANFANFTEKRLCQSLFLVKLHFSACNFIKKETLAQVFSCKFCKICKNTFSFRAPPVAPSPFLQNNFRRLFLKNTTDSYFHFTVKKVTWSSFYSNCPLLIWFYENILQILILSLS